MQVLFKVSEMYTIYFSGLNLNDCHTDNFRQLHETIKIANLNSFLVMIVSVLAAK